MKTDITKVQLLDTLPNGAVVLAKGLRMSSDDVWVLLAAFRSLRDMDDCASTEHAVWYVHQPDGLFYAGDYFTKYPEDAWREFRSRLRAGT